MENFIRFLNQTSRINFRFCGQGGQGVLLAAYLYGKAAIFDNLNALQSQQYGPESRGSPVIANLSIGKGLFRYPLFKNIDVLYTLTPDNYHKYQDKTSGIIIYNSSLCKDVEVDPEVVGIPATDLAKEHFQNVIYANIILLGFMNKMMGNFISEKSILASIEDSLKPQLVKKNIEAYQLGNNYQCNLP
jgi:2-oxoglutarate ferredoxin oxidoreductase subunit gamma